MLALPPSLTKSNVRVFLRFCKIWQQLWARSFVIHFRQLLISLSDYQYFKVHKDIRGPFHRSQVALRSRNYNRNVMHTILVVMGITYT